ncbi:hypothetical protein GH714_041206 [Hevea brasiliensis]|uniref:C3H1-type domain-containing protein n=1 Tax=Hevea brasiliensis TaxID=3981 RepID=A0A6A6N014_HEVBR|nr:hypothetical protein GH714_041206 [Hevea brasiliensis]
MEDTDGGLSFDFEGGLDSGLTNPTASMSAIPSDNSAVSAAAANNNSAVAAVSATDPSAPGANLPGRRSFRQTVCRHWLRSLCMKGDACGFLHQYDKSRMPVCRFFRLYGECREQDCVYKHTNEDIKECNMYKLGFCPNGPDCRYRHAKLPGPPPPVEEVLQKIQQLNSYNYGSSNKFFQQRGAGFQQHTDKSQFSQVPNNVGQGVAGKPSAQTKNIPNGQPVQANRIATPLPQGISRYFIVKSCNRENLELSVQQGVWATQRSNEAKLNEAFDSAENVILIFSVNRTRHFQLCELSFHKTRHLRNPYNENLPVKISRDCQELEPSIGEQLASLLYLEPDSELMVCFSFRFFPFLFINLGFRQSQLQQKQNEKRKKQRELIQTMRENPDIVPFEDNEEEEEEESEEEEEGFGQALGVAGQGRGRGRGIMWPQMPLARGARPIPGMRGFPPMMMGADGFSYGQVAPDGFGMPDLFGVAPRGFTPFGPRFSGDFTGPASGVMFPGRPSQPGAVFPTGGFGVMMGPGRAPFVGAMGPAATNPLRGNRPSSIPFPPLSTPSTQNSNRPVKRDQRTAANDRNDRYGTGSDQGRVSVGGPDDGDNTSKRE